MRRPMDCEQLAADMNITMPAPHGGPGKGREQQNELCAQFYAAEYLVDARWQQKLSVESYHRHAGTGIA
jgi:hypothetical protein